LQLKEKVVKRLNLILIQAVFCSILMAGAAFGAGKRVGPGVPPFLVRPGLRVTLAAKGLQNARFLQFDPAGRLFVSQPGLGNIVLLSTPNHAGLFTRHTVFVSHMPAVQAMVYRDGWLWFACAGKICKTRDNGKQMQAGKILTVISGLPQGGWHWWRSLLLTRHHLYTSIGDMRNINADPPALGREEIWQYNLHGTGKTLFCTGIRNTEKLLQRPGTHQIWGCDEGSDQFGHPLGETTGHQKITDLNPPEEVNHYVKGGFYGHPYVVGNNIPRYEWLKKLGDKAIVKIAQHAIPPAWCLPAHWSAVSACFLTTNYFPGLKGDLVVCCHGSWDSQPLVGYRLEVVTFDHWTQNPSGQFPLLKTLRHGSDILARPVNCVEGADGSLYFSSDSNNCIYQVTYVGPKNISMVSTRY
jgi:glucose/arabinose dehydrogenase